MSRTRTRLSNCASPYREDWGEQPLGVSTAPSTSIANDSHGVSQRASCLIVRRLNMGVMSVTPRPNDVVIYVLLLES